MPHDPDEIMTKRKSMYDEDVKERTVCWNLRILYR